MSTPERCEVEYPVSVIIPAYGAAGQLRTCLESLSAHLPRGVDVCVADDATPDDTIATLAAEFKDRLPGLRYVRRPANLGFVENCNHAMQEMLGTGRDLLLLNSDTKVTEGFVQELYAVLHLHEKHGAVTPRTNSVTIFALAVYDRLDPDSAYRLWLELRDELPRYQVMPTCVGFCVLIRNSVLRHFGLFDPAFSPGYNEENDFICRINSFGYSAVVANHAFVFHFESSTFGEGREALERRNRRLLDRRYTEYGRTIAEYARYYIDPIDHFSGLWAPHRARLLYDVSHLPPKHAGSSEFAFNLLAQLAPMLRDRCDVVLCMKPETREFFQSELVGYSFLDESKFPNLLFDVAFRPSQFFKWEELYRLTRRAARICYTHQDLITVRCDYINHPSIRSVFKTAAGLVDRLITISEASKADFEAFFRVSQPFEVIHQGTGEIGSDYRPEHGCVLVVGNAFPHKALELAVSALAGCAKLIVLGGERPEDGPDGDIEWLPSGDLSRARIRELYEACTVVVYPSLYEGFGLPILDALAIGRPVIAMDTGISRELKCLTGDPNLHLVPTHGDLRDAVDKILSAPQREMGSRVYRTWKEVAADYATVLTSLLESPIDVQRVRRRWELLSTISSACPLF